MIALGNFDSNVETGALDEYKKLVKELTVVGGGQWNNQLRDEGGWADFKPLAADNEMKVAEVQQFLKDAGFFPHGKIDRICGYRTTSAIRLFQEYVRTVEGKTEIGFPDGKFGKVSAGEVRRWQANNQKADWTMLSAASPSPEYVQWMALLQKVKEHYLANPSETLKKVNAFTKVCDTVKVDDWDFDPNKIHLAGIRHRKAAQAGDGKQVLDDVFILLIRGMAFKFYGSTEPGTKEGDKYPFLVQGQHRYRFGFHKLTDKHWREKVYHALKPVDKGEGVLVLRSKNLIPTDADLSGPLDGPNSSINIHWSGGVTENAGWSAGCQVITGRSYINHLNQPINCSNFAASAQFSEEAYANLGKTIGGVYRTKGAYTVLEDLVAALSGAVKEDNVVLYTLLLEEDLKLHPEIGEGKAKEILARLKS